MSRNPPAAVAQSLRAEAGFGCAVCGSPIVEYHHIIPWHERQHFDVDHMVCLCRNHHAELGKQNARFAYRAKQNPINIKSKRFKGYLVTRNENQALVIGSTRFVGAQTALSYFGNPIFGFRYTDGIINVQLFLPKDDFWPEIEVIDNSVQALIDGFWDIEFKSNYLRFRRTKGSNFLSLDFRNDDVEVAGRFSLRNNEFIFSPKTTNFAGPRIEHVTMDMSETKSGTAIVHGDGRIIRPNFAMLQPMPLRVP